MEIINPGFIKQQVALQMVRDSKKETEKCPHCLIESVAIDHSTILLSDPPQSKMIHNIDMIGTKPVAAALINGTTYSMVSDHCVCKRCGCQWLTTPYPDIESPDPVQSGGGSGMTIIKSGLPCRDEAIKEVKAAIDEAKQCPHCLIAAATFDGPVYRSINAPRPKEIRNIDIDVIAADLLELPLFNGEVFTMLQMHCKCRKCECEWLTRPYPYLEDPELHI